MLSPRAKAFTVQSLLQTEQPTAEHKSSQHHESDLGLNGRSQCHAIHNPQHHEADSDRSGQIQCYAIHNPQHHEADSDRSGQIQCYDPHIPLWRRFSQQSVADGLRSGSGEPGCSCYDAENTSLCCHPSILTTTDQHHMYNVSMELCQADLWQVFHSLGTEMIITRAGRRMFPSICLHVQGLEPRAHYRVWLEFSQCGANKYRYVYHSSKWMVAGVADAEGVAKDRTYFHPDSPFLGETLMSQAVSFERVKLTNNATGRPGQVALSSMQRFQPKINITKVEDAGGKESARLTCIFQQTSFMAVTAYQNQQADRSTENIQRTRNKITKLKIARNPFAKGFRESVKHKNQFPSPGPMPYGLHAACCSYSLLQDECWPWTSPSPEDISPSFSEAARRSRDTVVATGRCVSSCCQSSAYGWDLKQSTPLLPGFLQVPARHSHFVSSPVFISCHAPLSDCRKSQGQPVGVTRSFHDMFEERNFYPKMMSESRNVTKLNSCSCISSSF